MPQHFRYATKLQFHLPAKPCSILSPGSRLDQFLGNFSKSSFTRRPGITSPGRWYDICINYRWGCLDYMIQGGDNQS